MGVPASAAPAGAGAIELCRTFYNRGLPSCERRMSIKSDRWIRRMAEQHGMIEPFEPGQVREVNGRRVVSFGTSSYGYDIRCADEFKIFTNINSTIVDPKNFDEKSFVDFRGDVCIIPPNSFALARTVEYFRIPRNVLTICLGKCVTGDTRVVDARTGALRPIAEFADATSTVSMRRWQLGEAPVSAFISQGRKPVFKLRTRAGLSIRATANHPFRQLQGWTALSELRPGDRIAVARSIPGFGSTPVPDWEASLLGLMISEGQCHAPGHSPTFTSDDPVLVDLLRECVKSGGLGDITARGRHGWRLVNRAGRGGIPEKNRTTRWLASYGIDCTAEGKSVPQAIFTAPRQSVRLFLQALFAGDCGIHRTDQAVFLEYCSKSRRLVEDVRHLLLRFGIFSLIREKQTAIGTDAFRVQITARDQVVRFAERIGFVPGSIKQRRLDEEILPFVASMKTRAKSDFDTLPATAWALLVSALQQGGSSMSALSSRRAQPLRTVPLDLARRVALAMACEEVAALANGPVWDVVQSIEPAGEEEVYDLTVPGDHNFVANDFIVHNSTYARCGIICNVTPFEPEWEGYVTLEFSNTTPLPAKIYAGEGCAQVLFFESDEVCETSYKDRGGKYQGQRGVTLPKT
jgi:deoxycytidine triphosphate deaminase